MAKKADKRKKERARLKKKIAQQNISKDLEIDTISKYMLRVFMEHAPGAWEQLEQQEPEWRKVFLETFVNSSEIVSNKLEAKGLRWSELSDTQKEEKVIPFVKNSVANLLEINAEFKELKKGG